MAYSLVMVTDVDIETSRITDAYVRHIRTALLSSHHFIVVRLRLEIPADISLLDMIERWVRLCQQHKKQLIVVPITAEQYECLELSHPEQNIVFIAPGAELEAAFGETEIIAPVAPCPPMPAPVPQPSTSTLLAARDSQQTDGQRSEIESVICPPEVSLPDVVGEPYLATTAPPVLSISAGENAAVSGEYECLSCRQPRTWLKGDTVSLCENLECMHNKAGYILTFDLF